MLRWGLAVAFLTSVLIPCAASADDAAQARFHDERAREHYEHGRYEEALEEFFLEERLAPNPRTVFNIALCFDRLHRDEEAFLFFHEYLASDDEDAERRAYVATTLARIEPRVARLRVESSPPGATVYVDERDHGAYGVSPRLLALEAGAHHVILELDGYRTAEADVTLVVGEEHAVTVTLERILGHLALRGPSGATAVVRDDAGTPVAEGALPLEADLPPGSYTFDVEAEGHRPFHDVARVEADGARSIEAVLVALPPPTGEITVTSSVPGALVTVDGEPAGFAPTVLSDVSVGDHAVSVHSEGLDDWEGSVSVEPDVRSWLTVSLVPPARTTRSELTWIVGGIGIASAIAWGTLVGLAVANSDELARMQHDNDVAQMMMQNGVDLNPTIDRGRGLQIASDVMLGVSIAALGGAVLLYFLTEHTETAESSGSVAREER